MRIMIEDAVQHRNDGYPPDLLRITLRDGASFYDNKDYTYGFWADGKSRTHTQPGPWKPTRKELDDQTWRDIKDLFFPKRLRPPKELAELARKIHATDMINDDGARGGAFLPVTFLNPRELAVIKDPDLSANIVLEAILNVLCEHFGIARDDLRIELFPTN